MYGCVLSNCAEGFSSRELRDTHVIEDHHFPANYKFDSWRQRRRKPYTRGVASKQNRPLCRFYRAPEGCRYGAKCKFRHANAPTTPDEDAMDVDGTSCEEVHSCRRRVPKVVSFGHRRKR